MQRLTFILLTCVVLLIVFIPGLIARLAGVLWAIVWFLGMAIRHGFREGFDWVHQNADIDH